MCRANIWVQLIPLITTVSIFHVLCIAPFNEIPSSHTSRCPTSANSRKPVPQVVSELKWKTEKTDGGERVAGIFKKLALSRHRRYPEDRVAVWSVVWLKASRQIKYRNCRSSPGLADSLPPPSLGRGSLRIYWTEDEKGGRQVVEGSPRPRERHQLWD